VKACIVECWRNDKELRTRNGDWHPIVLVSRSIRIVISIDAFEVGLMLRRCKPAVLYCYAIVLFATLRAVVVELKLY